MTCMHTKLIYGTISMLQRLKPKESDRDVLFIGTDRMQYFNVMWNAETNQMEAVKETIQDVSEPYMRQSQSQNKCLVDPTGKYIAMHLWEGVLNVFCIPGAGRRTDPVKLEVLDQVRLTELWMSASTFIHSRTGHPRIAFLYKTQLNQEEARIAIYRLTKDDKGSEVSRFDPHKDRELDQVLQDPYSSMLIPVPIHEEKRYHVRNAESVSAHLGGLLVVGETLLTYFDSLTYSSVCSALKDPKIFVAWAEYDGTHFFLADDYGRLDLLTIETDSDSNGIVTGMKVEAMNFPNGEGLTSRASTLVYMGDDMLFLASNHGDSQLLRVDIESASMMVVKSFSNNGPIVDFAIMDMGNREGDVQLGNAFSSGQARIVAGCGASRDGSLRSIRSGVGLEDKGMLDEITNARGLFSVKSPGAERVDALVVSFIGETRVFSFDSDGGIEEVYDFCGLKLDTETLLAANTPSGHLLQITSTTVALIDPESGVVSSEWNSPEGKTVTNASANDKWAFVAVDGSTIVSLDLSKDLRAVTQDAEQAGQADQIASIHVSPDLQDLGVIGWWSAGTISIVDMATLSPVHGEALRTTEDSASVPRDLALVQMHKQGTAGPTLLVALEDGNVITFNVSLNPFALGGRKTVTLGSNPARLHVLPTQDGTKSVFATTEHSSLIYGSEGRIIYSATTADDATFVVPFDSEAFPGSIILATDDHLMLGEVDKERLTHVKTLPMYETVRRVAYSPGLKAFGLGCIKKELISNEEVITSSFRLVDEIIFQDLGSPFLLDASTSLELVECVIRAELPDSTGGMAERFIVGTSFIEDDSDGEHEQTKGRILVLGVDSDRRVYQIVSHNLKGACRCLSTMGEYIVAGLSKTVVVYNYIEETTTSGSLEKLAAYRPSTFPVDLDVAGNIIGVVDLMQSLTLVEFMPPVEGGNAKLVEQARHYQPAWATTVCHLDNDRWLEADAQGNLIILQRNPDAPTEQDRSRLEITSELNLGEQINRVRRLNVATTDSTVVSPRAFLASVSFLFLNTVPKKKDNSNMEIDRRNGILVWRHCAEVSGPVDELPAASTRTR